MDFKDAIEQAYKNGYAAGLRDAAKQRKCSFGNIVIKPDGIHDLDACDFKVVEKLRNVTIEVIRCEKCGHEEISWYRQEDTEEVEVE